MIPAGYSKYVIYSCINMSYAPRQSRAQSKTSQSCAVPTAAVSAFTRRRLPYGAGQRPLAAPGLSLSATSSASEAAASGERYQSRFHREVFSPIGEASSDSCPGGRLVLERVREPGVSGAANAETRAWLSGVPSAANFSSNIYLIVCCRISWNRFIRLLVPDHARPIGCPGTTLPQENLHDASRGHLHPGFFRSPEGGTHSWSTPRSTATSYRRNGYFKTKAIAALPWYGRC